MNYIYYLLCAIAGFALSSADIFYSDWQWWVVLVCIIGSYICGCEKNKKR